MVIINWGVFTKSSNKPSRVLIITKCSSVEVR